MFVVLKEEKVHQKPALDSNGVAQKFPRCTKKNRPQNLSVETQKEKYRPQNFFCYNKKNLPKNVSDVLYYKKKRKIITLKICLLKHKKEKKYPQICQL